MSPFEKYRKILLMYAQEILFTSWTIVRHIFATSAIDAGDDLFTVYKLIGHKDIQTTQIYAEVIMPTKIEAVNRLSDYFGQC